jgi:transposase-like protein
MDEKTETRVMVRVMRIDAARIGINLAGVSVRRNEDIAEARRVSRLSPSTVSDLDRKICARIDAWRNGRSRGASRRVP